MLEYTNCVTVTKFQIFKRIIKGWESNRRQLGKTTFKNHRFIMLR